VTAVISISAADPVHREDSTSPDVVMEALCVPTGGGIVIFGKASAYLSGMRPWFTKYRVVALLPSPIEYCITSPCK
jgi:hypothetical protein